jgi:hypothetical protein
MLSGLSELEGVLLSDLLVVSGDRLNAVYVHGWP